MLQCVAVCCSVLQLITCLTLESLTCGEGSVLQCMALCCTVLQFDSVRRSVLQCANVCCSVQMCVAVCKCVLQHITCRALESFMCAEGRRDVWALADGVLGSWALKLGS